MLLKQDQQQNSFDKKNNQVYTSSLLTRIGVSVTHLQSRDAFCNHIMEK